MKFAIITHVPHLIEQNQYFAYGPYVREMNIWSNYIEEFIIVAPEGTNDKSPIDEKYQNSIISFYKIPEIDIITFKGVLNTILKLPVICFQIFKAMRKADHIHLRCPGNIGLLGCFVQILFPNKPKTAKYAGNWDPKSKQPWSYKLQKWILSNTFLTRNMQVLVYGEWENQSKNIKSFFTATYNDKDIEPFKDKDLNSIINFVFVGTLSKGKNPLYSIKLLENLSKKGYQVHLDLYGEGKERKELEKYILDNHLESIVELKGNQSKETVKEAYQDSHFVLLPSESEGWPKVIAEGMFWGCVPLATEVSCVPFMLDFGKRGVLLTKDLDKDIMQLESLLKNKSEYDDIQKKAASWSRAYTMDVFEEEIRKMVQH